MQASTPLTRRGLLAGGIALGGLWALPRLALGEDVPRGSNRRTLVLLHLNGGNDGLNTVVPWKDPRYRVLRPSLALDAGAVRKVSDTLGFHPALAGFEALFRRDRLAVVNGVGYPEPNYSHFRSTEIWFTAQPERTPQYGWIGRTLDAHPTEAPLRAVALEREAPLSFAGSTPGSVTLTDFGRFRVPAGMDGAAQLYRTYAPMEGTRGDVGAGGAQALDVAQRIAQLQRVRAPFQGPLGDSLGHALALLKADLGLECIQLSMGGYDTHSNQGPAHNGLLAQLGNNLNSFQAELEKAGLGERVVTLVMSEFGRRATENLSGGTDHGSAGPVFVIGQGLVPGFHGAYPSLEDLDQENFKFTTDFRSVYAAILASALRVDPRPIVGEFTPLGLFA
ncbi:MAG: DUF1501 domain-containing protein [Planctomycetota bacterium]|nr:DUF1501 domain-containing protein [Planctomycetota bacterium]